MNRGLALGLLLLAAGALVLRLPRLDARPMHCDESVQAIKFLGLWQEGTYRYDPNEYHGPLLPYATLPFAWLSGARDAAHLDEATLRLVPVTFGTGLILLLLLLADGLGRRATLGAGLLTTLSPGMVYYSRYYIHEMALVGFTLLLIGAGWRYARRPRLGWALLAGAAVGLMYATKETFVFTLAALALAAAGTLLWRRWVDGGAMEARPELRLSHWLAAAAVALAVGVLFFSSFFTNASGPLDSLRTYLPWLRRAGGASPHIHPWYFYLERLGWFHEGKGPVWSEGVILVLAAIGGGAALGRRVPGGGSPTLLRFLTFYTVVLTAIYSAVAYKTPWCALSFLAGMILLAGAGAVVVLEACRGRWRRGLVGSVLVLALSHLGFQAWRAAYPYAADPRNPYVYAHTSPDILRLIHELDALAAADPQGRQVLIKVIAPGGDYWPLPWYLRGFARVGWWNALPADPYAPMMIVGAKLNAELDEKSEKQWVMTGLYELRPRNFVEFYVQFGLWKKYVESLPRPRDD